MMKLGFSMVWAEVGEAQMNYLNGKHLMVVLHVREAHSPVTIFSFKHITFLRYDGEFQPNLDLHPDLQHSSMKYNSVNLFQRLIYS